MKYNSNINYITRFTCRMCGSKINPVFNLGKDVYLNNFITEDQEHVTAPLVLAECGDCHLVQLQHTSNLDLLYRQYWYKSSLNKSMVAALQDIIDNIECRIELQPGDTVVDIGVNDGTMISQYHTPGLFKVGFDPALNLAEDAKNNCDLFYNTYFGDDSVNLESIPPAKVITAIAMFYDLENPHEFLERIKPILASDGIFVIQLMDILAMLQTNAFDNICHEHLEYYSFENLDWLFSQHGMRVFDASRNSVNGGSLRLYVTHMDSSFPTSPNVEKIAMEEFDYFEQFYRERKSPFIEFGNRIETIKRNIQVFIHNLKEEEKTIFVMGASTKGNTLLQYFNLTNKLIPFAAEVNKDKFGKKTVGTNIPIIDEKHALQINPDYFLVLPWHFIDNISKKLYPYLKAGGKLIVPLPEPVIYEMQDSQLHITPLLVK